MRLYQVIAAGLILVGTAALSASQLAGLAEMPPAPGPFVHPTPEQLSQVRSFSSKQPLVGTYYFYWYEAKSGFHILNADGSDALVNHPPTMEGFSYLSQSWHEKQLRDILAAGLDFALPVYWGAPDGSHEWSNEGLKVLVQAWEKLAAEGLQPPRIGLFYDTSSLAHNNSSTHVDLRTEEGKRWFFATVRNFYSQVPPKAWFAIDGRPVVWLYTSGFAAGQDETAFDYLRKEFAAEFGRVPYIVKEVSWLATASLPAARQGKTDNTYQWGGALGLKLQGVAALGPGYDDRAVPGRRHMVLSRNVAGTYREAWREVLALEPPQRPKIVVVETWNEFHEGTDICESREYGRRYIELTAEYAGLFKAGSRE